MAPRRERTLIFAFRFAAVLLLIAEVLPEAGGQCTVPLKNLCVYENETVQVECGGTGQETWRIVTSSDELTGLQSISDKPLQFTVNSAGLTIAGALAVPDSNQISTAGYYVVDSPAGRSCFKIIVSKRAPTCSSSDDPSSHNPKDRLLSIRMQYADSGAIQPVYITVKCYINERIVGKEEVLLPTMDDPYWKTVTKTIHVQNVNTADRLSCALNFTAPEKKPYPCIADNAPSITVPLVCNSFSPSLL